MENELPFRDWKRRTSKMDEQVNSGSKGASEKIYRILFEFDGHTSCSNRGSSHEEGNRVWMEPQRNDQRPLSIDKRTILYLIDMDISRDLTALFDAFFPIFELVVVFTLNRL